MDWIVAIPALVRVFRRGLQAWEAYCDEGIDAKDLRAISDALADASQAAAGKRAAPDAAAQHLGLITAAFGRAFERHWVETRSLDRPGWLRRRFDREADKRDKEIQTRLRLIELPPLRVGDRAPGTEEMAAVDALVGSPLSTPYYRELWRVFSDPRLDLDGDEPPLDLDPASKWAFERHFMLAYRQALEGKAGDAVRAHLHSLEAYRPQVVRECLIADMATWDQRHVFGNVARSQWDEGQRSPFLPLGRMYVEPDATLVPGRGAAREQDKQPILTLLEALLDASGPYVTVVKADFGTGKSLTARTLVYQLAQKYQGDATTVSRDLWLPIFVRCSDDMLGEAPHLDHTVRSTLKRHAENIGISHDIDDPAFALPDNSTAHFVNINDCTRHSNFY